MHVASVPSKVFESHVYGHAALNEPDPGSLTQAEWGQVRQWPGAAVAVPQLAPGRVRRPEVPLDGVAEAAQVIEGTSAEQPCGQAARESQPLPCV